MTLIELLVVITILTTLVAGVIPLLSPNNDARKIREASREMTSYITLAQAEAARTGRSHGVYLKKLSQDTTSPEDRGVCLEVYQIGEPASFAGFSTSSTVKVYTDGSNNLRAQFGIGTGNNFVASNNELPLAMFRPGDILDVQGNRYMLVRETPITNTTELDANGYFASSNGINGTGFLVQWQNYNGQHVSQGGKSYKIRRFPIRTAQAPLQFPSGVCIDLQCSGLPVDVTPSCVHNPLMGVAATLGQQDSAMLTNNNDGVAVMFAPNGTIDNYFWNSGNVNAGNTTVAKSPRTGGHVYFLIGRRENIPVELNTVAAWNFQTLASDAQKELRTKVNWLNEDSRWVVIGASNGRVLAANNAFVDLTNSAFSPPSSPGGLASLMISVPRQLYAARQYAREMRREGGR